jgi:hypothetical protein
MHTMGQFITDGEIAIAILETFKLSDTHKISGRTDLPTTTKE